MSVEKIMLDSLKAQDYEDVGISYWHPDQDKDFQISFKGGSVSHFYKWADEEISKIVNDLDLDESEINIFLVLGVTSEAVQYFSIPSNFILGRLKRR